MFFQAFVVPVLLIFRTVQAARLVAAPGRRARREG